VPRCISNRSCIEELWMTKITRTLSGAATLLLVAGTTSGCSSGAEPPAHVAAAATRRQPGRAADMRRNPLRNAYYGDLHVHTSWSLDAYSNGDHQDDPAAAYRYGRGDALLGPEGKVRGQLRVPLDFMAVTDHDAFLGEVQLCHVPGDVAYDTPICRELRAGVSTAAFLKVYQPAMNQLTRDPAICGSARPGDDNKCNQRAKHLWTEVQKTADAFYQPGRFTTFTGFEWTGADRKTTGWLHRNVIFRGPQIPVWGGSAVDMKHSPERLWEWLERACTGDCQAMAIPHNTNYGMGVALAPTNSDGTPLTRETAASRIKAEPLIEIHQIKGNSECMTGYLTSDENCNFEQSIRPCRPGQGAFCAHASNFVRNALKTGLVVEANIGVNPFKYGIIGSTDDHKSAAGSTGEQEWPGSFFGVIGGAIRESGGANNNPGGLAAVWAEENTRESIFDALRRRETFGTSGTRIRIRFFGGWTYPLDLHTTRTLIEEAYKGGVPMGSDLPAKPAEVKAPRLVVWATKDPNSAGLQKIQIVKGWTEAGETREQVYDVACADGITPDLRTHRCVDTGATVNLSTCQYDTDKGAAELSTTWTDPDFNSGERAFYYIRVLENPTCRWSTWQAVAAKAPPSPDAPALIQERAWSSPIWYTPTGR
jgi:hypothetical protein